MDRGSKKKGPVKGPFWFGDTARAATLRAVYSER